ncbi:MAG: Ligand-binding SRPBCC domain protein family, partial [uncultured Propionibacteriaceae bacterium]
DHPDPSSNRGGPQAADHPHHPRFRGDARAAVPGPHRTGTVRPVGRTQRHRHPHRALGGADRRQLEVRRGARRRGVRLPRVLPRGAPRQARPDVHLRGRAGQRGTGNDVVRGARGRPDPAARPVPGRQLRRPGRLAEQRDGDRDQRGLRQARRDSDQWLSL